MDTDIRQHLIYVASIPHEGITYLRTHNLFYMVTVTGADTDRPKYDWSKVDRVLDFYKAHGFKPFLVVKGVPRGMETPGKKREMNITPEGWRRLTRDAALHFIDRYGVDEVRTWFFEVWNEPDNWPLERLCNYYDACSQGLMEADPQLRWGGPGTWNTLFDLFKGLLTHCESGKNLFTGEIGTRMDFISVHEKGIKRSSRYEGHADVKEWVDRQIATIRYIRDNHPRFAKTLFVNDECDGKSGWWNTYFWRTNAYFPALLTKYMSHHIRRITFGMQAETIASSDTTFLGGGGWQQRSQVVRFGEQRKFELIKKPINAGMIMLSLLGDTHCALDQPDLFSDVGAIATRRGKDQIAVLIYNCNDAATRERHDDAKWVLEAYGTARIQLSFQGLPFPEAMLVHYRVDNKHGNPHALWKEMGEPEKPSAEQFARMRADQELTALDEPREVKAEGRKLSLEFDLPMPGVSLVVLSAKPAEGPGKVTGLLIDKPPSLIGADEAMLFWKSLDSRMIRTYEVLCAESPDGPFQRVNASDIVCTAFLHVRENPGTKGYYKVRAVDYWGRAGQASKAIPYPPQP